MREDKANSFDKLDVDNYDVWSVRMRCYLVRKSLDAYISKDTLKEEDKANDNKAKASIMDHVCDHHLATLRHCNTSKEAWDTLEGVFEAKSKARQLHLRRELNTLRKLPKEPLSKYMARAKAIRNALAAAGQDIKENDIIGCVLAGLPKEYDVVVTILETSEEDLTLNDLLTKLLPVEQRVEAANGSGDKAYYSNSNSTCLCIH